MGQCLGASATVHTFPAITGTKKLDYEQRRMLDRYMPDFCIHDTTTEAHREIAANHWNAVFKEMPSSRTVGSIKTIQTGPRGKLVTESEAPPTSKIAQLYDVFYEHLSQHSPELKHVFRSSMQVRSKVLVHISTGMRSILANEFSPERAVALTRTHLRFGVKLEYFNQLGLALIYALKVTSGDMWSRKIELAWRRMFAHSSAILMVHQKRLLHRKQEQRMAQEAEQRRLEAVGPSMDGVYSASK